MAEQRVCCICDKPLDKCQYPWGKPFQEWPPAQIAQLTAVMQSGPAAGS